eukprot:CAMPEP_0196723768 /NCGR_PEP_ID=MMETSP1091-20130531/5836_1 /TAXON_ID=302021 /ORGANISM="Rhodomonas sp., Strain CCMP768" /LENGTH=76 /DNA_ID=CAMNT_0042065777 /DNA_START=100 /DNA_END=326 /DNA_ORIENTATION=+
MSQSRPCFCPALVPLAAICRGAVTMGFAGVGMRAGSRCKSLLDASHCTGMRDCPLFGRIPLPVLNASITAAILDRT